VIVENEKLRRRRVRKSLHPGMAQVFRIILLNKNMVLFSVIRFDALQGVCLTRDFRGFPIPKHMVRSVWTACHHNSVRWHHVREHYHLAF